MELPVICAMSDAAKNILYLSSFGDFTRGGQKSLYALVTNLDREAFAPCVVLPGCGRLGERLKDVGIDHHVLTFPRVISWRAAGIFKAIHALDRLCKMKRIDLIHADGPRNAFYGGVVARLRSIPMVWHIRASNRDPYDRLLYSLSSKIILVAKILRRRFQWVKKDNKFVTIYNGIDVSIFRNDKGSPSIRKRYGIDEEELLISVTARVEHLKGQKLLIEACGKLGPRLSNYRVLLAGEITEPAYRKECQELAAEYGIKDKIIFSGHVKDIPQIMNATDIFVLPSLFEACPRALIEAMGAGRPAVTTDVGGCAEAVENGVSGFSVPPGNTAALGNVLLKLAKDKQLRNDIGAAARIRAEKMFTIGENVRRTEEVYHELLAGGRDAV